MVIGSPSNAPKVSETVLDDLVKGMEDHSMKVVRLQEGKAFQSQNEYDRRCIWCDSLEHSRERCNVYKQTLDKGIIFFRDGKIHSAETQLPLTTNFKEAK